MIGQHSLPSSEIADQKLIVKKMEKEGETKIAQNSLNHGEKHSQADTEFDESRISLKLEQLQDHSDDDLIGTMATLVAFKNATSYLIGTYGKGIKIIENHNQIYAGRLPVDEGMLDDIVYADHADCYFLHHEDKIYRKDIDEKPAFVFMSIYDDHRGGISLQYSKINRRLLAVLSWRDISVIDIERKQAEIELKRNLGKHTMDFRVFGKQDDLVISVSKDGLVFLYVLSYDLRKVSTRSHLDLELLGDRKEQGFSVAVNDSGEYALVQTHSMKTFGTSRMFIVKIEGRVLTKAATLDQFSLKIRHMYALDCFGASVGKHLLWVGLSDYWNGQARLYDFDTQTGVLRELEDKRVDYGAMFCSRRRCLGSRIRSILQEEMEL